MKEKISAALAFYKYNGEFEESLREALLHFCENELPFFDEPVYLKVDLNNFPSGRTLSRAIGIAHSKKPPRISEHLLDLVNLFLAKYDHDKSAGNNDTLMGKPQFAPRTQLLLAAKAHDTCSNPECQYYTKIVRKDQIVNIGYVCPIYVPYKKSPRYAVRLTKDYTAVTNGIWLCVACCTKCLREVFTVSELQTWKQTWEAYVRSRFPGTDAKHLLGLMPDDAEINTCVQLVSFFKNVSLFHAELGNEFAVITYVGLAKKIITHMLKLQKQITPFSLLDTCMNSIIGSCRYFIKRVKTEPDNRTCILVYKSLRKIIGINLYELSIVYDVRLGKKIKQIIPVQTK